MKRNDQTGSVVFIALFVIIWILLVGIFLFVLQRQSEDKKIDTNTQTSSSQKQTTSSEEQSQDKEIERAVTSVAASLEEYAANNNGSLPLLSSEVDSFNSTYIDQTMLHPVNHKPYLVVQTGPKDNELLYLKYKKCGADGTLVSTTNKRSYAIQAKLISGENYCIDNS
jgi:hypothetical protein